MSIVKANIQDISNIRYDLYVIRVDQEGNIPLNIFNKFSKACYALAKATEIQPLQEKDTLLYELEDGCMVAFVSEAAILQKNDYWSLGHYVRQIVLNYEIDSCCFINFFSNDFWNYDKVDDFCSVIEKMLIDLDLIKVSVYE